MVRTAADDEREALVSVEAVAYGLAALDVPVWESLADVWTRMDRVERDDYRARARYVLGIAEDTPAVELRAQYQWMPEEEVRRRGLTGQVVGPGRAVKMSLHTGLERPAEVSLPKVERTAEGLRLAEPARPAVVQLGDQRAVCTCGRWQFEDDPEPGKHISGCAVTQMVGGPGQPSAVYVEPLRVREDEGPGL